MAEEDAAGAAASGSKSIFQQKAGPLPIWVWAIAALGVWYYFQKKSSATSATAGTQTDPAGNTGTIDPQTGYVYGTPEDTAALTANNSSGSDTSGTSGSTTGGTYADNNAWAEAAIDYLVGVGVDPTTANEAIQQYLSSQTLTAAQQGDVNLAIQSLGSPPNLPGPVGTPPTPIVTPPPVGTIYAANPPTGLTVGVKTPTTVGLSWNKVTGATGYDVKILIAGVLRGDTSAPANQPGITVGALVPGTLYTFQVQALPVKTGAAFASVTATTPKATATPAPPKTPAPAPKPAAKTYTVKAGDNLTSIADALKYPGGWQALYAKNKTAIGANPNLIHAGLVLQL
jgi:hypothetical protein